jgi:hypothetical protein
MSMAFRITRDFYWKGVTVVTADMFPEAKNAFIALGLPVDDFVDIANTFLANPYNATSRTRVAQCLLYVACVTVDVRLSRPLEVI